MQIKVSLNDLPNIFKIAEFSVTVNPCQVETIEITAGPEKSEYTTEADKKSLGFLTTAQAACSYSVTYEQVDVNPFISIDQATGEMFIQNDDRA